MTTWETVRRQVAIAGRVTNSLTGLPLPRAGISITGLDVTLDLTTTSEGYFHAMDLADGTYTVKATLPEAGSRYGGAQSMAVVSRDGSGKILMARVDLALNPTTIKGNVSNGDGTAVAMAEIGIRGRAERVYSDSSGNYSLIGIEKGNAVIQITARGYQTAVRAVNPDAAGTVRTENFILVST